MIYFVLWALLYNITDFFFQNENPIIYLQVIDKVRRGDLTSFVIHYLHINSLCVFLGLVRRCWHPNRQKNSLGQTIRETKTYTDKEVINRARTHRPTDGDVLGKNDYTEVSIPGHWFGHAFGTVQQRFVFESLDKSINRSVRISAWKIHRIIRFNLVIRGSSIRGKNPI